MKKIVFFSLEEGAWGGVRRVNRTLASEFLRRGYAVEFLYLCRRAPDAPLSGVQAFTVSGAPWRLTEGRLMREALRQKKYGKAFSLLFSRLVEESGRRVDRRAARDLIEKRAPDYIIASHYLLLDAIPEKYLSRTVMHVHTSFAETWSEGDNRKTLEKYNGRVRFLFLSKKSAALARKAGLAPVSSIINPAPFAPQERVLAETNREIVFLTRFSREKDLPAAVRILKAAFGSRGDYTARFFGEGEEKEALLAAIGKDGRFFVENKTSDPAAALRKACLVMNTSRFEGLSLSLLEAQTLGVPALSYRNGESVSEVIREGETGFLFRPGDEAGFAEALSDLLCDPKKRKRLSETAFFESRRFAVGAVADAWEALFALPGQREFSD